MGLRTVLLAVVAVPARAVDFLAGKATQEISSQDVQEALQSLLTSRHSLELDSIEEELREMYVALPKNTHGLLDHATVRYALHRYFVQKHGWYMNGLDPHSDGWRSLATTTLMKERAPSFIQTILEERLHGEGLGLHDMAVFVAALSSLVHQEVASSLHNIFHSLNLPEKDITSEQVETATKNFVIREILGLGKRADLDQDLSLINISLAYPEWEGLRVWMDDLHQQQTQTMRNPFDQQQEHSFETAVALVQDVAHSFGSHQKPECLSLKRELADMDRQGTGRVLLRDFYNGLQNNPRHKFAETVDYLRNLGALDERDPNRLAVVIPNYVISKSNCLAASGFYAICCSNECESLMRRVEHNIAAPSGSPARIAEVISSLPSDTVDAPRNLSSSLLGRLDEIAKHHGGEVPLYGRLFSQFMHHAFPRECPFPHVSGTTSPMTTEEWLAQGVSDVATPEEVEKYFTTEHELNTIAEELPWIEFEELVVDYMLPPGQSAGLRYAFMLLGFVSIAAPLMRSLKVAGGQPSEAKKYSI